MTLLLLLIAAVLLLSVLLSKLSSHVGVPALLAFLLLGMLFGSDGLLKIPFENYDFANQISTVALIFIIFYGGFGTNWKAARRVAFPCASPLHAGRPVHRRAHRGILLRRSPFSAAGKLFAGGHPQLYRRRLRLFHPPLQAAQPALPHCFHA